MQNIVMTGMKIDLHIHSCASSKKDGKKVKNNTVENLPVLVEHLVEQEVNICSVTDHDTFSYEIYSGLKKEELNDNSIKKVLPGVEFSVRFKNNDEEKVVHVISVFSDKDEEKVKSIESILNETRPDEKNSYTEESFIELLRKIDIDTILIAHQKNSLFSGKARKNDVNSLGNEKFLEFIYSDYFEAFEFKNKKNEILNKNYLTQEQIDDKVGFVTGTDCHVWKVYPREDKSDQTVDFPYTYAKCLPTFKGLVMAMTDPSRLKRVNSFFNVDKVSKERIIINSNDEEHEVPLSKGINVIIGDNSIGKSMLLHALTDYKQLSTIPLSPKVKTGYKQYMNSKGISIKKQLDQDDVFCFDMQGEIREKFEHNHLNATDFLSTYFPTAVDASPYRTLIENEIDRMINYLSKKFEIDEEKNSLNKFSLFLSQEVSESLAFDKNLRSIKKDTEGTNRVISKLKQIILGIEQLLKLDLDDSDFIYFEKQHKTISDIINKYTQRKESIEKENKKIETIANTIDKVSKAHDKNISDSQKKRNSFLDNTTAFQQRVIQLLKKERALKEYEPDIKETKVIPSINEIHDYKFISKLYIDIINKEYIDSCIRKVIKAGRRINWRTITERGLKESILRFDEKKSVLEFFRESLLAVINDDLKPKNSIISRGMDVYQELSSGFNSKIYFDILSYERNKDGIYIIDQPEDNVSQKAIRDYLLDCFKTMGENRQVIMVTHNPQFIVNLDVDNIIYLFEDENGFNVQSGALEFECDEYSILDIVANTIDGGLDSLRKRWKRYEKVSRV